MKAIYLSTALLFFSMGALAQTNFLNRPVSPRLKNNFLIFKDKRLITPAHISLPYGIIKLPQHSMPCFVPDVSSIATMPTVKTVFPYQFIPNPYFKDNSSAENPK